MKKLIAGLLGSVLSMAFLLAPPMWGAEATATAGVFSAKIQHFVDDGIMAGAVVLVADKDKVLSVEAVGYADLSSKKEMKTDDLFWIASMSKPITAAAFMMLVDEGKVKLDDAVEKYIPDFAKVKVAQKDGTQVAPSHPPTVREILSHTSGLRFLNAKDKNIIDAVPLADSIQNDLLEPLLFDPGTRYQYSNEGIDSAGLIIQLVSGMPYEKFLQDRLFTPLGMKDTTFHPTAEQMQRLAKSYATKKDKSGLEESEIVYLKYPLDGPDRHPSPGGGLFSTANDVARFMQMLANGGTFEGKTYLSKEAVHQLTIKQTPAAVKDGYGLGFAVWGGGGFGHGGAYKTNMSLDRGLVRVFMVQQGNNWAKGNPEGEFTAEAMKVYRP